MSKFTEFTAFSLLDGTDYQLDDDLVWDVGWKGSGMVRRLPRGFVFNLSVPRGLRWIISPHNRQILPAAAIHDEILKQGGEIAFASAEFRRACLARGVDCTTAWALFFATLIWLQIKKVVSQWN